MDVNHLEAALDDVILNWVVLTMDERGVLISIAAALFLQHYLQHLKIITTHYKI